MITLRAGFALKTVSSPVNGLMPLRAFVAGLRVTLHFIKPGTVNSPGPPFFKCLCITSDKISNTVPISFLDNSVHSEIYVNNSDFFKGSFTFKAGAFLGAAFGAVTFLATVFLAVARFAGDFLAVVFLAAAVFTVAFFFVN